MLGVPATAIAEFLGRQLYGSCIRVVKPASIRNPQRQTMVFLTEDNPEVIARLNDIGEILVLVKPTVSVSLAVPYITTDNPRLAFARVVTQFFAPKANCGVASSAVISNSAKLGDGVTIGHFTVIHDDVVIGDNCTIDDHVVLRACTLGRDCIVRSGAVIGEEGFGFEFDEHEVPIRIPHLGRVMLGDGVEIGALVTIARGTLDDTVICNHVKINDNARIAHNVYLGANTMVHGNVSISGSVTVGRNVWLAPHCCVKNKVTIGDYAMIGMGAIVLSDIPSNVVAYGCPAVVRRTRFSQLESKGDRL